MNIASRFLLALLVQAANSVHHLQPLALTSSKDVLALRLKYSKTTLFLPCLPTHTLAVLKTSALQSLVSSGQQAPLEIESSFAELTPQDIKLFTASRAPDVSGAGLGPIVYRPLEEEGAKVDTVAAAGFKDGMEVFLGFRKKGDGESGGLFAYFPLG